MVLPLVALAALGADPGPVAVVATSKRVGTEAVAPKVTARVLDLLQREGLTQTLDDAKALKLLKDADFPDPRACNGGRKCVQKIAILLGPRAVVVGVDVGKVGKTLAIHLEAFSATSDEPLAVGDVSTQADTWKEQSAVGIITFARSLKEALAARSAPSAVAELPKDAPATPPLTPAEPAQTASTPPPIVRAEPEQPSRTGAFVTLGFAGASLAASGVLLGLGLADKAALEGRFATDPSTSQPVFRGLESERVALVAGGNLKFTLALSTALVGAVLGGLGTWLLVKE